MVSSNATFRAVVTPLNDDPCRFLPADVVADADSYARQIFERQRFNPDTGIVPFMATSYLQRMGEYIQTCVKEKRLSPETARSAIDFFNGPVQSNCHERKGRIVNGLIAGYNSRTDAVRELETVKWIPFRRFPGMDVTIAE